MVACTYTVGVVRGAPGRECFDDFVRGLRAAFRRLGVDGETGRLILFGAVGAWDGSFEGIPENAIIYNAEQVVSRGESFAKRNFGRCGNRVIWDYASANFAPFRALRLRVVHCPVGYVPEMETITPAANEDIDVLFYGAMSLRRKAILVALEEAGLRAGARADPA